MQAKNYKTILRADDSPADEALNLERR